MSKKIEFDSFEYKQNAELLSDWAEKWNAITSKHQNWDDNDPPHEIARKKKLLQEAGYWSLKVHDHSGNLTHIMVSWKSPFEELMPSFCHPFDASTPYEELRMGLDRMLKVAETTVIRAKLISRGNNGPL